MSEDLGKVWVNKCLRIRHFCHDIGELSTKADIYFGGGRGGAVSRLIGLKILMVSGDNATEVCFAGGGGGGGGDVGSGITSCANLLSLKRTFGPPPPPPKVPPPWASHQLKSSSTMGITSTSIRFLLVVATGVGL